MHVHIVSLGKETEHAVNCIRAIPKAIDKVYLLSSKKFNTEAEEAKALLERMKYRCEIESVSGFDYKEIESKIYRICNDCRKEYGKRTEFSINITGGTNLMSAAACSASLYTGATVYYMLYDPTNPDQPLDERLVTVEMPKIPDEDELKKTAILILRYLYDNTKEGKVVTNKDISDDTKLSPNVVKYHVRVLSEKGLIVHKEDPRNKKVCDNHITRDGIMFVDWWL